MNHFSFDKHWDAIKGQLKQRHGHLTDDDLTFAEGRGDELLARLREKLGLSAQELDALLDELSEAVDDARAKAGGIAQDLKAKAVTFGDEAKAQANAAYDQARRRAHSLHERGREYVQQNPRESLLVAVCAGFVAGLLLRR
jgi:ElaB/YqjD/DUF883 family membrane-anchored ribosome-binding protein